MRVLAKTVIRALVVLTAMTIVGSPEVRADRGGFVIRSFHTELTVAENADLLVEELIDVEFQERRHGIYRTIPIRYTDPRGFSYSLQFRLLSIEDQQGRSIPRKTSYRGRGVSVRIGDAKKTVIGNIVYRIRYRVRGALVHFPEHDELYWNATGNEWQTAIERATAQVNLPRGVPEDELEVAGFVGFYGSRRRETRISASPEGRITYAADSPLQPLEGLTVLAAWPHGLVQFPGRISQVYRFLIDNPVVPVPFVAAVFLWRRYRRRGRDPVAAAAIMVRYEPPPEMTPAEIGTLADEKADLRDITATVLDLAVRGFLSIEVEEESRLFGLSSSEVTVFEKVRGKSTADLTEHEKLVLSGLFEKGNRVTQDDLENEFYKHLPKIRTAIYSRLVERGLFESDPEKTRRRTLVAGVVVAAITFGAGLLFAQWRGVLFPYALLLPAAAAIATLILFASFSRAMPRRTPEGVSMKGWAQGFENFVTMVEKDRLDQSEARRAFESLLPYAMALGVTKAWGRRFEGIYDSAAAHGPSWFSATHAGTSFSTSGFERSLSSAMSRASTGMAAAPRSSGSSGGGGGGFSGGGGGGGGGGSW